LNHLDYKHMSPVIIPPGYTRDYIDGKVSRHDQLRSIHSAYNAQAKVSDMMLLEGTGHIGVGSCVNANNAQVAAMVGADMVLVANGGLGSAFDELDLNYNMCKSNGVRIAGVVINKVKHDKIEQTRKYMSALLKNNWGVPLLGVVPDKPFLGCPALADLERLFNTELLSGHEHRMRCVDGPFFVIR
jgi:dethiobiotin synthetase